MSAGAADDGGRERVAAPVATTTAAPRAGKVRMWGRRLSMELRWEMGSNVNDPHPREVRL
ncbi:hypothetical protein GCM10009815_34240 [Nocardioides marmoribigeumensis]